jgi:ABC-type sugar transport system ATPase subunit
MTALVESTTAADTGLFFDQITKRYGRTLALNDVSFSVERGTRWSARTAPANRR